MPNKSLYFCEGKTIHNINSFLQLVGTRTISYFIEEKKNCQVASMYSFDSTTCIQNVQTTKYDSDLKQ